MEAEQKDERYKVLSVYKEEPEVDPDFRLRNSADFQLRMRYLKTYIEQFKEENEIEGDLSFMSPEDKVTFIFTIPGTPSHEGKKRTSKKKADIPPKPDTRLFRWKMIDGTEGKISEKYGWIEEEYYYNWDEGSPPSKDDLMFMELTGWSRQDFNATIKRIHKLELKIKQRKQEEAKGCFIS